LFFIKFENALYFRIYLYGQNEPAKAILLLKNAESLFYKEILMLQTYTIIKLQTSILIENTTANATTEIFENILLKKIKIIDSVQFKNCQSKSRFR